MRMSLTSDFFYSRGHINTREALIIVYTKEEEKERIRRAFL